MLNLVLPLSLSIIVLIIIFSIFYIKHKKKMLIRNYLKNNNKTRSFVNKPLMIIGPSGVGKDTFMQILIDKYPNLFIKCVSCTTRSPRKNEKDGINYYFISKEEFNELDEKSEIIGRFEKYNNLYGTSKEKLNNVLSNNKIVYFDYNIETAINTFNKKIIDFNYIALLPPNIQELENRLRNDLQTKLTIKNVVNSNSTDNQIPTAKAVWDAITNYQELFVGVSLDKPKHINAHLDTMREPGYYMQTGTRYFSYGGEAIYYTNALVKVEKQANRVIQHVYATSKITSNGTTNYKINGSEYTRWGLSENDWKPWHVAHKPYTKTTRACNEGRGVDVGSVIVYENTSGFIVHWDQFKQENDKYPVSASLYSWATVCEFSPALPIKGPYVFGNLIGRCDFKITSNKLQIRSNVRPNL